MSDIIFPVSYVVFPASDVVFAVSGKTVFVRLFVFSHTDMKRIVFAIFALAICAVASAQEYGYRRLPVAAGESAAPAEDTGMVAALMPRLWMPEPFYMSPWQLHEGFNAQLGMSVTAGFGKHMPRGVGFGSNAAFVYAMPFGERLAFAGGVNMQTLDWGGWKMRNASVFGVAAYRLNERMNVYAFGEKSLVPGGRRLRNCTGFGEDRWGGAVDFKLGDHVFVQFGVSQSRMDY